MWKHFEVLYNKRLNNPMSFIKAYYYAYFIKIMSLSLPKVLGS